jgi:carbamoyl-phosphate synthase large subunit
MKVFTADMSAKVATAFFSDEHFVLPPTSKPDEFTKELLKICINNEVKLVIPTRDGELPLMAEIKDYFGSMGILILVPSKETTEICINKRLFAETMTKLGHQPVPIIDGYYLRDLPVFVRPVTGSASRGACKVDTWMQMWDIWSKGDFLIHPIIDAKEYSMDLLMNLDGTKALQAVCRERIHIVSGESKISRVVHNQALEDAALHIGEALGLVGHNVLQAFYSEELGPIIIEANARFGGASNLCIRAGLNSPARIVHMLLGKDSAYKNVDIIFGLTLYRYSKDVIYEESVSD